MDFNLEKYKKFRFHKDDNVDKKVKALFLYYDYLIINKKLTSYEQLVLLDFWILKFEEHELYEVIPFFKLRREVIIKQINIIETKIDVKKDITPKLNIWGKIKKSFKKLFF